MTTNLPTYVDGYLVDKVYNEIVFLANGAQIPKNKIRFVSADEKGVYYHYEDN